jgi:hypothetical protein
MNLLIIRDRDYEDTPAHTPLAHPAADQWLLADFLQLFFRLLHNRRILQLLHLHQLV